MNIKRTLENLSRPLLTISKIVIVEKAKGEYAINKAIL